MSHLEQQPDKHKCTTRQEGQKVIFHCDLCGQDVKIYDRATGEVKTPKAAINNPHLHSGSFVDVAGMCGTTDN